MVSIARALSRKPRILVLDEPTSPLTENEVEALFKILVKLRDSGISCIYISHKMQEIMGAVTQLIMKYLTGQTVPYLEYYEFFEKSVLIGVPDFVPQPATDGDVKVLPAAFGLLSTSLLNVSRVKTGYVTCVRLVYAGGKYKLHVYTGEAKTPESWNEFGWDDPAPQLPSLEVFPDSCTVEELSRKVSSQHVIRAHNRAFNDSFLVDRIAT